MAEFTVWGIIFIITLSEVVINTQLFIHGNSHGYMPANNEVRYLVDELPLHKEFPSGGAVRISNFEEDVYVSSPHLRLNPRVLDFKDRHLGVPHHEKVTVFNTNGNKTIQLTSISGNTVHFHSSFFEDKVIPPLGNTSFSVVFLGREEGTIESTLFIHTSEGSIKYPVRGNSISSPYRLRPLVGVHMPINSSFAPLIHMHNPHSTPIQIVEIYSSGGELSLELPSGELEATKNLWEIRPFETKPVIRARLLAQAHRNHTCYVRIRVNGSSEHLVIPLEVEVGTSPGLYPPDPSLDLGVLGSEFPPTRLSIRLHNSGRKSTLIQNVFTVPASKAVKIDFHSIKVPPDSKIATEVAVIIFDPKAAYEEKHFSGKIVVKGKNRLVIPYHARVLQGGLQLNASLASFCTDLAPANLRARNFTVRNTFLTSLVVGNVSLPPEAEKFFEIRRFSPRVLAPGEEVTLFELVPNISSLSQNFHLESYIQIITNVSIVTAPLLCYDGHVIKVVPPRDRGEEEEPTLDVGLLGVGGQRDLEFALLNPNPVEVALEAWGLEGGAGEQLVTAWVELLGVAAGTQADVLAHWDKAPANLTQTMLLQPRHFAVFRVGITAAMEEGYVTVELFVKTRFERLLLPLKIHVAKGNIKVEPETVIFDNCFPGKMSTQPLTVHSSFQQAMKMTGLTSLTPDARLSFVKMADVVLKPFASTMLGELQLDPRLGCRDHCYLGVDLASQAGLQWLQGFRLQGSVWEQDATLLSTMYMWFLSSVAAPRAWLNTTMRLDTSEVRGHRLNVATRLTWPSLVPGVPHKHISFPLTQVGNTTTMVVQIQNPADSPLLLQIAMGALYSPGHSVLGALPVMLHPPLREAREASPGEFWMIGETAGVPPQWVSDRNQLEGMLGVLPHERSLALLLKPGTNFSLSVHFAPLTAAHATSLLFIRNNLTTLEVIRVSGQGAQAQFKFGNRKPGSPTPLQFDLSEKHLKDCSKTKWRKFTLPLLTVKRSFTARNTGELPVYISSFLINDLPCEGFGFKVLNCKPFLLTANSSRKVEIAFSPDFTLARVQRLLKIITSLGPGESGAVNYSLVATLPISLLAPCGQAIPRPTWEAGFYYSMLVFMVFLLFCTVAAALIESDRIHKCSMIVAVAAATAALSRANPRGTSVSPIPQSSNNHQQQQQQHIPQAKNDTQDRKRELNISTSNRTQPEKEKSHSPDDSQEDDNRLLHESLKQHESTRSYNGSVSPQPQSHIRGSKRKLSKKHSAGNSDASEAQSPPQHSESSHSWGNSGHQSKSQLETCPRKTVWSGVFVRSNGTKSSGPGKTLASSEHDDATVKFTAEGVKDSSSKRLPCNQGKSSRKNRGSTDAVVGSEEDNSSTTTESSNNDEVDKEGHAKTGQEARDLRESRDSYEGDGEEEDEEPRTRRGNSKVAKQTKAALEQPSEQPSSCAHPVSVAKQGYMSPRQQQQQAQQQQENHKNRQASAKQLPREKNNPRIQGPAKRKPQTSDRPTFRVLTESDSGGKSMSVPPPPNWEPPVPPPAPDPDLGPSPLLYSKIVAPVPESPPPAAPTLPKPAPMLETNSAKKKESPGPIGPKPLPKRIVPPMQQRTNWDLPAEPRMGYTAGMAAAAAAMVGGALECPAGLLDVFSEPNSLLADSGSWDQLTTSSVMKVLQEERRRRVEQHQQRQFRGIAESWPRFEPWDTPPPPLYCPLGPSSQFSTPPPPVVEPAAADVLWDGGAASQAPMWTHVAPWLAPTTANQQPEQAPQQPEQPLESTPQFDLFGSVTHLWDLPHTSGGWAHGEPHNQP